MEIGRKIVTWGAVLAALGVLVLFAMPSYRQGEDSIAGKPAKEFSLEISGKPGRLSDYKGKIVVLNFWATWCPPCVEETPGLNRLQKHIAPRNGVILGVAADEDAAAYERFLRDQGVTFPTYRDPATRIITRRSLKPTAPRCIPNVRHRSQRQDSAQIYRLSAVGFAGNARVLRRNSRTDLVFFLNTQSGLNPALKRDFAQPQCVGNDGNGAEAHRGAGEHGTEQQAISWIEDARGDGNADDVVEEREEKVLLDVRTVARLSLRARTMPRRSPFTSVIPAFSMATSVPVPMAIPTSAAANAGASLIPSPAIATARPCFLRR